MNVMNQGLLLVAVQSTVLLTAFLIALRWWNTNPFSRHALGSTALTACMLLPLGLWLVPATLASYLAHPETGRLVSMPAEFTTAVSPPHETLAFPAIDEPMNETINGAITRSANPQVPAVPPGKISSRLAAMSWDRAVLFLWAFGFLVSIATRVAEQVKLRRLAGAAEPTLVPRELGEHLQLVFNRPTTPRLLTIDHAFVPFVVGLLKPAIVLPRSLLSDLELLKQVVTHEQAHIHRRDTWSLLWQQIVSAVFWWQPLLQLINRELSAARESIADAYVVSQSDPIRYAENILRLAEAVHVSRSTALAFLNQPPTLEDRVRQLLTHSYSIHDKRAWPGRGISIAISVVVLFLCGGVAIQSQLNAQEPAASQPTASQPQPTAVQTTTAGSTSPAAINNANDDTAKTGAEKPSLVVQAKAGPSADEDMEYLQRPPIEDNEPRFVTGRVLSPTGEPVKDCLLLTDVHVVDRRVPNIVTRTDDQGEFKLTLPGNVSHIHPYLTWLYKEGYGLCAVQFGYKLTRIHRWDNCTIVLPGADPMTVQVQDPNGQPVADAILDPISYQIPNGSFSANVPEGLSSDPPAEIVELVRAKTNSEGKAELKGFNAKLMGGLKVTTDTYGSQLIGSASKRDWQIRLQPVGSLRLKLVGADATKAKGSMLRIQSEPLQQAKQPFANTSAMQTVAFDGQGELVIPKILAGDLQMWPWFWPLRNEYLPELPIRSIVRPGTETVVEIKLLPSVEVKGRVVLEDSLEPGRSVGVDIVGREDSVTLRKPMIKVTSVFIRCLVRHKSASFPGN